MPVRPLIIRKTLPFILLLALVGCDRTAQEAILGKQSEQVRQWVPIGTALAKAQETMEQHQYRCSVISFDSVKQMQQVLPNDIGIWKETVIRDQVIQAITNVTYLECKREGLVVLLRLANGEMRGIYSVKQ